MVLWWIYWWRITHSMYKKARYIAHIVQCNGLNICYN